MYQTELYAVAGVSGRTGATVAQTLLNKGNRVRVIVRNKIKGDVWSKLGAEVMVADMDDVHSLTEALSGVQGAYMISPPQYASNDLFLQADSMAGVLVESATIAKLPKLVVLSSVGAEKKTGTGWIGMNHILEQYLSAVEFPVTFLRAAYFMENWIPMIEGALETGILPSFLAPLDTRLPMIATADIGRLAVEILKEEWIGVRIAELEGPESYTPQDLALELSFLLNRPIDAVQIPFAKWPNAVAGQAFSQAALAGFIEMTAGINSGHIAFNKNQQFQNLRGNISLKQFLSSVVKR